VGGLGVVFFLGFVIAWAAGWHLRSLPVSASGELTPYQQTVTTPGPVLPTLAPATRATPAPTGAPPADTSHRGGGQ
jgi:hypothetical protein